MQTNVSLEEELRKANATKGQLETYKRQVGKHTQPYVLRVCVCVCIYSTCVRRRGSSLALLSHYTGGGTSEQTLRRVKEGRQDGV